MSTNLVAAPDPFDVALRYMPAPYARGSATQELFLVRTGAGTADVRPYDFSTFLTRYGLQSKDIGASYVLTLRVDQLSGPAEVDIAYASSSGAGTAHLVVPAGSLAGTSFALGSLPKDPGLVVRKLTEHPAPGSGQPSGPDKWALTVLLGNVARLIRVRVGRVAHAGGDRARRESATPSAHRARSEPRPDRPGTGRSAPAARALPARFRSRHRRALSLRRCDRAGHRCHPRSSRHQRRRRAERERARKVWRRLPDHLQRRARQRGPHRPGRPGIRHQSGRGVHGRDVCQSVGVARRAGDIYLCKQAATAGSIRLAGLAARRGALARRSRPDLHADRLGRHCGARCRRQLHQAGGLVSRRRGGRSRRQTGGFVP